jgi:hypothetical protein
LHHRSVMRNNDEQNRQSEKSRITTICQFWQRMIVNTLVAAVVASKEEKCYCWARESPLWLHAAYTLSWEQPDHFFLVIHSGRWVTPVVVSVVILLDQPVGCNLAKTVNNKKKQTNQLCHTDESLKPWQSALY